MKHRGWGTYLFGVMVGFGLGVLFAVLVLATPEASAVPPDQAMNVCVYLDKEPTDTGVVKAARHLLRQGYDTERVAEIMVSSVAAYCPEHLIVLDRFGQKYA